MTPLQGGLKLLPRDVQTRRKEEEDEVAQLKTPNKWVQMEAWKERKKMEKSTLQSKLKWLICKEE